jgi:nucleotide-binding universal stress UspA family protein
MVPLDTEKPMREAHTYLARVAASIEGEVHTEVGVGAIVDHLTAHVHRLVITDVVMASHGLTGLSRVILGSVADALIHRLRCPVIVVPALAAEASQQGPERDEADTMEHGSKANAQP